jgi:multidrug efflux pump subunit AcrA (membrane-fusion protein)
VNKEVIIMKSHRILWTCISIFLGGALFISACGLGGAQATPTPDLEATQDYSQVVSATGIVVPEERASMTISTAGRVEALLVEEGQSVEIGDVLIRLEGREELQAQLETAQMELVNAQNDLADLYERAPFVAAETRLELANAHDALNDAERRLTWQQKGNRATDETIEAAKAQLVLAQEAVDEANRKFNTVKDLAKNNPRRAAALVALEKARERRDAARASFNWYTGEPTDIDQAIMEAEVGVAMERVSQASQKLEKWKDGPDPDQLERLEKRLDHAQAQVEAAEAALAKLVLTAPFSGTIGELYVNEEEWVSPGQQVLLIADLDTLMVETTDLHEIDVAQIAVGDRAILSFDAFPELVTDGTVTWIAVKANEGAGVNYRVEIAFDEIPGAVRWGMTAFVDIELES